MGGGNGQKSALSRARNEANKAKEKNAGGGAAGMAARKAGESQEAKMAEAKSKFIY